MSELLPPWHEVMHSVAECDKANDRVAVLEAENLRLTLAQPIYSRRQLVEQLKNRELQMNVLSDNSRLAEAELAALKGRTCGTCCKWTTKYCAVAWMDGEDCVQGAGDHDDYCPYWEARKDGES